MARFFGILSNGKGNAATKAAGPETGLTAKLNSWNFGVKAELYTNGTDNIVRIYLTGGSNGSSATQLVGEYRESDLS